MIDKEKKMIFSIGIVFLFLAIVSFSYAYFNTAIINDNVKDQVVETGTLILRYVDGPEINMQNIKPGSTITKTVYVANTGTLDAKYNLVWQELVNEIISDEMVIEAKCTRMDATTESESGSCNSIATKPIKDENIKKNITIEPSIVHKYDITITFIETNTEQNYNQGKKFTGTLGINEYVDNTPIYCTFDGEMVQGAEYVNGQYTYRYMQKGDYSESRLAWRNISDDGWGVQLTNKTSTKPVTSKLCTYINNKPVTSMSYMFSNSSPTTIDISSFNTSNITDMSYIFYRSAATTLDFNNFDTSKVTNMAFMFELSAVTALDLSSFDTSSVTDMSGMFSNSAATTINLSSFDTSNVINMRAMFIGSDATNLDLSSFDTSNVTNMSQMFCGSSVINLDLNSFDTSNVTNMSDMFSYSVATTLDLSNFDTSNVTDMSSMFYKSKSTTLDLSSFDTSNVIDMGHMFYESKFTTLDLSSFDTSNVKGMNEMFSNCDNLETIYVSYKFNTNAVVSSTSMFYNTTNLVGGAGTTYNSSYIDKTYARIDGGTRSPGYFTLKNS